MIKGLKQRSAFLTCSLHLGFADGEHKVGVKNLIGHLERQAVEQLVLQKHHWIIVTDSCLQEASTVLRREGGDHLHGDTAEKVATKRGEIWTVTQLHGHASWGHRRGGRRNMDGNKVRHRDYRNSQLWYNYIYISIALLPCYMLVVHQM